MEKTINVLVRFAVFVCFLGSSLWSAQMAYETSSAGFAWLAFALFVSAVGSANLIYNNAK